MRNPLIILFCIGFTTALASDPPEANSQFARDFMPAWQVSTQNAIDVAEAMPADLYDYKPNDSSMTFREQITHISFTTLFLAKMFAADEPTEYKEPDLTGKSKEEVVNYLKGNLQQATQLIADMSEKAANEEVKVFSGKMMKRYVAVLFVQDHLTNHRAKANLYIRMNDIKPPAYGFF